LIEWHAVQRALWRTSRSKEQLDGKVVDWMEHVTDEQYLVDSRSAAERFRSMLLICSYISVLKCPFASVGVHPNDEAQEA